MIRHPIVLRQGVIVTRDHGNITHECALAVESTVDFTIEIALIKKLSDQPLVGLWPMVANLFAV